MLLIRYSLDRLYLASGVLSACLTTSILALILWQIGQRWTGSFLLRGIPEYAGYCLAASSFLAFPYALARGAHIQVNVVLEMLGTYRRTGQLIGLALSTAIAIYVAFYACRAVYLSYALNDISQGQDATPLWIPQMGMAAGTVLLAIALFDKLVCTTLQPTTSISAEN